MSGKAERGGGYVSHGPQRAGGGRAISQRGSPEPALVLLSLGPHFSSLPRQKLTPSTRTPSMPSLPHHPRMMATWSPTMPSGLRVVSRQGLGEGDRVPGRSGR